MCMRSEESRKFDKRYSAFFFCAGFIMKLRYGNMRIRIFEKDCLKFFEAKIS